MLHDMWHNITQHHVTSNPKNVLFLVSPTYAVQGVQSTLRQSEAHIKAATSYSLSKIFDSVYHFSATLCLSLHQLCLCNSWIVPLLVFLFVGHRTYLYVQYKL